MLLFHSSNSSNCTALLCCLKDETSKYVFAGLLVLLAMLVVFGNMLVVIIIYSYKIMRTSANSLLCSLALIGVLHGAILTPLYVLVVFNNDMLLYNAVSTLQYIIFIVSLMIVAYMTYDRLTYICKPIDYELSFLKALLGLVQFELIPLLLAIIIYFASNSETLLLAAQIFILICLVAIAILLLSFCIVHKRTTSSQKSAVFLHMEQQSSLTVLLLYVALTLSVVPSIVHRFLSEPCWQLCTVRVLLLMANHVLNPMILFFRKPAMRSIALLIVCKQKNKARSARQSTQSYSVDVFTIS